MNSDQTPFPAEPGGGQWHKYEDPSTGLFASKTAGWTADSFSSGFEVDFSSLKREGMRAVRVFGYCVHATAVGGWFYRKGGDTNISNTPIAAGERSHELGVANAGGITSGLFEIWLSSDYKAQFAVAHVNYDIYIAPPIEYLL